MKRTACIIAMVLSQPCLADESFVSFGIGAFNSAKQSHAETKVANLGYRSEIYDGIFWQWKAGFWGDGSGDSTRKSSFYVSTGPGMLIDLKPVEIRAAWGIGGISTTDSYLGGRFPQFNGEIYIGLRDHRGNGIGVKYEHISSAGLVQPNGGRDFTIVELSQGW